MVAAPDHIASQAGVAMLRAGGSAADAAVAAAAVLAVTFQHVCGMGGDLFAMVHAGGEVRCLRSTGRAGSGADPERLRARGFTQMPLRGEIAAVPVPGCVDGWLALHRALGRLPLADVLAPAIDLAERGFPASPTLAAAVPVIADLPSAGDYRRNGPVSAGTVIRRPGAAEALRSIAREGRAGFYQGAFRAGFLTLSAGEHAADDLATDNAEWVEPAVIEAFGHRVWTAPPPSQGYITLAASWIASGLDLPADPGDPRWAHDLIEASRQAGFDRPEVLWEGASWRDLLAAARLEPRRAAIGAQAAALGDRYRAGGTVSLCAIDSDRTGVALIQSNAAGWGSHLIEPSTGIFLQNRGLGFSLTPGHPAEYGPGRRPPHTLSPALVTGPGDSDTLRGVVASMGGDSQPQILLQVLARWLGSGQPPADAVAAGRWTLGAVGGGPGFDTWDAAGDVEVRIEGHAPTGWNGGLVDRGHRTAPQPSFHGSFGWAQLIANDGDTVAGGSDPRPRSGAAAGW